MSRTTTVTNTPQYGKGLVWMSVLYLMGLFIGAIDSGIITPARPIIQNQLGVDAKLGIWMITIYTLTYAAVIPISGKMADKRGRKPIYLLSIALFGTGSVICATSAGMGSFAVLMLGRVVQASGAGGIMPVATAEFGTSFPEEKRGMALGLVGAVYGIANVIGASVGSGILDIVGVENWQWIFLVNVPICIFIVIAGIAVLPNNKAEDIKATDKLGTVLMTMIILSLLYGLKNLDFFDIVNSITDRKVWPFLLLPLVLIPIFGWVEKRAEDPIFHIEYLSNRHIMITLGLAVIVGCSMMGMIFIPQFAENALKIPTGSGGYFVVILGLCAGVASMASGKMIDNMGAKPVMAAGFIITIIGCLYLNFVTVRNLNMFNVVAFLLLMGFGLGLTMGTPLNYMMLQNTTDEESNSALATLSLVRSIGTAVAPAIMVGFITHAAAGIQTDLMNLMPKELELAKLPHAEEIDSTIEKYKNDPNFADQMKGVDIPKVSDMTKVKIEMGSGDSDYEMPADVLERLQNSDVTNITENTVYMVDTMFGEMSPAIKEKATAGIGEGIKGIRKGSDELSGALDEMQEGYDGIGEGIDGIGTAISAQKKAVAQLDNAKDMLKPFTRGKFPKGMNLLTFIPDDAQKKIPADTLKALKKVKGLKDLQDQIKSLDDGIEQMNASCTQLEQFRGMFNSFPGGIIPGGKTLLDLMPPQAQAQIPDDVKAMLDRITDAEGLEETVSNLKKGISSMKSSRKQLKKVESMLKTLKKGNFPKGMTLLSFIPADAQKSMPEQAKESMGKIHSLSGIDSARKDLLSAISTLEGKVAEMQAARTEMGDAMSEMQDALDEMNNLTGQLVELKAAIPQAIDDGGRAYSREVEKLGPEIEKVFQDTLNEGFSNMYWFQAVVNALGLFLLLFYREKHTKVNRTGNSA